MESPERLTVVCERPGEGWSLSLSDIMQRVPPFHGLLGTATGACAHVETQRSQSEVQSFGANVTEVADRGRGDRRQARASGEEWKAWSRTIVTCLSSQFAHGENTGAFDGHGAVGGRQRCKPHRGPITCDQKYVKEVKSWSTKKDARKGNRRTEARQCKKVERRLLHCSGRC